MSVLQGLDLIERKVRSGKVGETLMQDPEVDGSWKEPLAELCFLAD